MRLLGQPPIGKGRPGTAALERCPLACGDWRKIDAAEIAGATKPAPRRKFTSLGEMLKLLADGKRRRTRRAGLRRSDAFGQTSDDTTDEMKMTALAYAGDISPMQAWKLLSDDDAATLVDVRTPAEWNYVGVPDLSSVGKQPVLLPWVFFPSMERNEQFVAHLEKADLDREAPLLFICRSGARSRAAAIAMTARGFKKCYNVGSGFEGDLDQGRHRGTVSGWKAEGLPWLQG